MGHRQILAVATTSLLVLAACERSEPTSIGRGVAPVPPLARAAQQPQGQGDPAVLARMRAINAELAARGLNIAVEAIEAFTIGKERPSNRLHQLPFRWVPNDPRRLADGTNITYLVDLSDGATSSRLRPAETEAAVDAAVPKWVSQAKCSKLTVGKRPDPGTDPDIFDAFFGFGSFGFPFFADITNAGWLPGDFFDAVFDDPDASEFVLAFSVTFIFVDDTGSPTDVNGDGYLDQALNEVYYNDNFGSRRGTRARNPWAINAPLPAIDVQTVALHENGHSVDLGHFGPPPAAVMNPVYAGIRQSLFSSDEAGQCTLFSSWPTP